MLVGTLPCGAATSQSAPSQVLNNQVQLGDVFSTQTLNVETVTDQTVGESHASGNQYQASTDGQRLDIRSNQTATGATRGDTRLNVATNSGKVTAIKTTAVGNSGDVSVVHGVLTGVLTQVNAAAPVASLSHIEAPHGKAGDVDTLTQAGGNSHSISLSNATAGLRVNQSNHGQVTSNGGGVYGYVSGRAQFQAQTIANDVTYVGEANSAARIATSQQNETDLTQAAQFTAFGQVQEARTSATVTGNNLDAVNQGFLTDVSSNQHNSSYLRAQSDTSAASFGAVTADAHGTGNSLAVGDIGGELVLDTTQTNEGGGIEALATTTGGDGFDAFATADAAGNAVTGYACSDCSGHMTISNHQTNSADVGATATTNVTGTTRSVTGISNAVGNTATYFVSKPGSH